jgi:hypothetical protein
LEALLPKCDSFFLCCIIWCASSNWTPSRLVRIPRNGWITASRKVRHQRSLPQKIRGSDAIATKTTRQHPLHGQAILFHHVLILLSIMSSTSPLSPGPSLVFLICCLKTIFHFIPETAHYAKSFDDNTWLESNSFLQSQTPTKKQTLLITDFGWNHPNKTFGLTFPRSKRLQGLLKAVEDHPDYLPAQWSQLTSSNFTNDTHYYVFLDVETCFEANWPEYGGGVRGNSDRDQNRAPAVSPNDVHRACQYINQALTSSPFISPNIASRLVLFDCGGNGPKTCMKRFNPRQPANTLSSKSASLVSLSASTDLLLPDLDMGMPPPAVKPISLTEDERRDIQKCDESNRTILLSFAGNFRCQARLDLSKLHNGQDTIILHKQGKEGKQVPYSQHMRQSLFAAVPRGDNLFSYRLTEAMSAGAIPVIYADDWVLPFRPNVVDWNRTVVIIPEAHANHTRSYLNKITKTERCELRRQALHVYDEHMSSPEGTIRGILESLEHTW